MFKNQLKEKLKKGQPAIGIWNHLRDSFAVEAMAAVGFDWWAVDTEHTPATSADILRIISALEGTKTVPLIRLMNNEQEWFKVALDLGAQGVVVPMIETVDDARRAVSFCRYPPQGLRGFAPIRASRYFLDLAEYCKSANDEILLVGMIESLRGVQELDGILKVPGLDAIYVGPGDLSASMGSLGNWHTTEVQETIQRVISKCVAAGVPCGTLVEGPEEFARWVARGATLMTLGSDMGFMMQGGSGALKRAEALLAEQKK
ncbi:MAG: HpcH/HpaI aldolase family protein [Terriglobia bacterium]